MQLSRLDVSVLPVKKSPSKKPAVPRPSGDRLDAELSDAERLAGDLLEQHEDVLADEITIEEPLPQVRHHEREVNRQGAVIDQSPALEADQSAPSRDAEPGGHRSRSRHRGAEQHLIAHHATFGEGLPQAQQVVDPVRQRGRPGSGAGAGDPLHQALPTKEVESRPDGVAGDAIVLSQSRASAGSIRPAKWPACTSPRKTSATRRARSARRSGDARSRVAQLSMTLTVLNYSPLSPIHLATPPDPPTTRR